MQKPRIITLHIIITRNEYYMYLHYTINTQYIWQMQCTCILLWSIQIQTRFLQAFVHTQLKSYNVSY